MTTPRQDVCSNSPNLYTACRRRGLKYLVNLAHINFTRQILDFLRSIVMVTAAWMFLCAATLMSAARNRSPAHVVNSDSVAVFKQKLART